MKPNISEFSYGYAIVEQIARDNSAQISAAPVFPSLIQEGRQGGGYDAGVQLNGVPLFLQFKLSDYLERQNAKEAGSMGLPYYRMHIRSARHSDQHAMLLDLENTGEQVFYAAPMFHKPEELNEAYLNRQVFQRSLLIKPSTIGSIRDLEEHYVAFNDAQNVLVCSKPREIEMGQVGFKFFAHSVKSQIKTGKRKTNSENQMADLRDQMIRIIDRSKQKGFWDKVEINQLQGNRSPIEQTAYLARTFIGCEMLVVRNLE